MQSKALSRHLFAGAAVAFVAAVILGGLWYLYSSSLGVGSFFSNNKGQQAVDSFNQGRLDSSIFAAEDAVRENPSDIDAKLVLALAYAQKGSFEFNEDEYAMKAIVLADQVLVLDSANAEALYIKGYANEIMEKYDEAIQFYNTAITIDPTHADAYSARGHVYDLQGELEFAEENYRRALEIDPALEHALLNMARIEVRRGSYGIAEQYLGRLLSAATDNRSRAEAFIMRGSISLEKGEYEGALGYFGQAISEDSKLPAGYIGRAKAKLGLINDEEAATFAPELESLLTDLSQAIELHPDDARALYLFGSVLFLYGNEDNSKSFFEQALAAVETDITLTALEKTELKAEITQGLAKIK